MKYTICFDTICEGYQPVMSNDEPMKFDTEEEAQKELDTDRKMYEDCFVCEYEEIGHKSIYYGEE